MAGAGEGREGSYRLPPPSFPAQALFDDPRYHRTTTPSSSSLASIAAPAPALPSTLAGGSFRSQSVPFGAHDVEMHDALAHAPAPPSFVSPTSPRAPPSSFVFPSHAGSGSRPPSSGNRPSSRQSAVGVGVGSSGRGPGSLGGGGVGHPQLSSRSVHPIPNYEREHQREHSKNFKAQTLRAAAEDCLRREHYSHYQSHSHLPAAIDIENFDALSHEEISSVNGVRTPPYTPEVASTRPSFLRDARRERSPLPQRDIKHSEMTEVEVVVSPLTSPPPSPPPVTLPAITTSNVAVSPPAPVLSPVQLFTRVY
ncbi:hypothetical protein SCHPADRAFT_910494 [Schizopora paradoxa]|uniref:Uncharacterized protein n=1 Tax=Schizopora paradoxa TaxID=27342 RepID=A0A0H2R342_9AGAM|nr:hypothetical protein SCHPADRAFT_910494 [Schizopora paradoxa]